jgi:hypothetical protein
MLINHSWILVPIAFILGYALKRRSIYRFQNSGEILVRREIMNNFSSKSWYLFNNVTLRTENGTTQIDHILISQYGVFVIETKHYKGWLFGDANSKKWTQVIFGYKYKFQNPLHQNYKHIKIVQSTLDFLPSEQVTGLVVFTGDAEFKTSQPSNVYSLKSLINHLNSLENEVLSHNKIQFCVGRIEYNRLELTKETDIEHIRNLDSRNF